MSTTDPTPTDPPADPAPTDPPAPAAGPTPDPTPDDAPLGPAGEKALAEWKARARDAEKLAKTQADLIKAFEDEKKTDAEKLADKLAAAEARATKATGLAVAAKVEALAAGRFADPQDAVDTIGADFLDADGQIDTGAIEQALAGLLERKPHWAAAQGPRVPAPDPSQGARPGGAPTLAQQVADAEAKGDVRLSLALKSRQLREMQTNRK